MNISGFHINNMSPRLNQLCASCSAGFSGSPLSSFLLPFLQQQQRAASILSSLSDTKGAYNKRIRRGRGPASGKGKTSGRGHGGQKQHGKVPRGFQGGQTPLEVVHGKRGFENQYVFIINARSIDTRASVFNGVCWHDTYCLDNVGSLWKCLP